MQMGSCRHPQLKKISITLSTDLFSRVFQSLPVPTHLHCSSQPPQLPTLCGPLRAHVDVYNWPRDICGGCAVLTSVFRGPHMDMFTSVC